MQMHHMQTNPESIHICQGYFKEVQFISRRSGVWSNAIATRVSKINWVGHFILLTDYARRLHTA